MFFCHSVFSVFSCHSVGALLTWAQPPLVRLCCQIVQTILIPQERDGGQAKLETEKNPKICMRAGRKCYCTPCTSPWCSSGASDTCLPLLCLWLTHTLCGCITLLPFQHHLILLLTSSMGKFPLRISPQSYLERNILHFSRLVNTWAVLIRIQFSWFQGLPTVSPMRHPGCLWPSPAAPCQFFGREHCPFGQWGHTPHKHQHLMLKPLQEHPWEFCGFSWLFSSPPWSASPPTPGHHCPPSWTVPDMLPLDPPLSSPDCLLYGKWLPHTLSWSCCSFSATRLSPACLRQALIPHSLSAYGLWTLHIFFICAAAVTYLLRPRSHCFIKDPSHCFAFRTISLFRYQFRSYLNDNWVHRIWLPSILIWLGINPS